MNTDTGTTQLDVTSTVGEAGTVSSIAEQQEQPPVLSPRELAIAAIDQQVELARQQQEQEYHQQTEPVQQAAVVVPPQADQQAERKLKVKVDGEELEVPESQVIESFQKISAADRKMKEAAEALKKVEAERQQLKEEREAQQTRQPEQVLPGKPDDDAMDKARALLEAINKGIIEDDGDDAVTMLADILGGKNQSAAVVDETQISEIVQKVSTAKELERDFVKAKSMFDTEYGFINQNPRLTQLANNIYNEHVAAGKMPSEAAKLTGEEVKGLVAPTPEPTKDLLQQKQERKGSIDTIKPAGGITPSSKTTEESSDPRNVIAEMKRLRGQT